jgi:hypothetical protein
MFNKFSRIDAICCIDTQLFNDSSHNQLIDADIDSNEVFYIDFPEANKFLIDWSTCLKTQQHSTSEKICLSFT